MSTPVGARASLVSEDTEVDNILATTPEVDDDMAIPDTVKWDVKPSLNSSLLKHVHYCCYSSHPENIHHTALASCIAYVFRRELVDFSDPDIRPVESCPTFLMKDSKAFWLKLNEKVFVHFSVSF